MTRASQKRSIATPGGIATESAQPDAPAGDHALPTGSGGSVAVQADAPGPAADLPNPDRGEGADRGVVPRAGGKTRWVLVADEAIARILQWPEVGDELESVEELTDPAAHARERNLQRDATGRRSGSATHSASPSSPHRLRSSANLTASAGEEQQHLEASSFARRVAQHLGEALRQKRFAELCIVAAPRFLGHLRQELDAHVGATVTQTLNKDLVHARNDELSERLRGSGSAAASGT